MRRELLVCLCLALMTFSIYWQVQNFDFVRYDDDRYVTENRHVQMGVTAEEITWAFTSLYASNWHPVTWLSHMLDCQLYGLNPKGHHLTNLLFHILNTLLLFLILKRMTDALWRSAFVAALFAVHPLHVESVAWVAERKDVLSTFFWMLTLWAYTR
ncbi:MAG: tetratricopeptide repeat protein, partial [Syntrophales bacterium]